MQAIQPHFVRI